MHTDGTSNAVKLPMDHFLVAVRLAIKQQFPSKLAYCDRPKRRLIRCNDLVAIGEKRAWRTLLPRNQARPSDLVATFHRVPPNEAHRQAAAALPSNWRSTRRRRRIHKLGIDRLEPVRPSQ